MRCSPAEVVAAYLVAVSQLTRPDASGLWPVTIGQLPIELPDNRVALFNPETQTEGRNPRTNETYLRGLVQIRVQSKPQSAGYEKIMLLLRALEDVNSPVLVTTRVPAVETVVLYSVVLQSGPMYMGQDEKNQRENHVMNYSVIVQNSGG